MTQWLAVAFGGAIGAMARYGLTLGAARIWGAGFPWGTLTANALGCFLLGMLAEWSLHTESLADWQQQALRVGFLGAFTTFSTFAYDTFRLAEKGQWNATAMNLGLNLLLGLIAVAAGVRLIRRTGT